MDVSLWFDPICPFCWMTSRWLLSVSDERDLRIDWRSISLLLKNDPPADDEHRPKLERTHGMLRVVESVRAAGDGERVGELYTELGRRIHHDEAFDFDLVPILEGLGLATGHAAAAEDASFDKAIQSSMDEGIALTGDDVGTPLIALDAGEGRVGFFGPALTTFPDGETGLRLWDGLVAFAGVPGFSELKTKRRGSPKADTIPPELIGATAAGRPSVIRSQGVKDRDVRIDIPAPLVT
jgi:hypothetical protein